MGGRYFSDAETYNQSLYRGSQMAWEFWPFVGEIVDAKFPHESNWTRYVNGIDPYQTQDPELWNVLVKEDHDLKLITYWTKRTIQKGEELLIDYGPNYWSDKQYRDPALDLRKLSADALDDG